MRVKRGTISKAKHKKILASTKGYRMTKRRLIKVAKEAMLHSGQYSYTGRKKRKSDFRRLWITRISHAVSNEKISYSKFFFNLKKKDIQLDRKILSDLIISDNEAFQKILTMVKKG